MKTKLSYFPTKRSKGCWISFATEARQVVSITCDLEATSFRFGGRSSQHGLGERRAVVLLPVGRIVVERAVGERNERVRVEQRADKRVAGATVAKEDNQSA